MTPEERFDRMEHVTAGLVEERRKDREEFKQLWRDTQRQLNELSVRIVQMGEEVREYAKESHAADDRLRQHIESVDQRLSERIDSVNQRLSERIDSVNQRLGERIESLVSAIGELLAKQKEGRNGST